MTAMKTKNQQSKKFVIKRELKFEDYKHCLEATQLENKTNQLGKNKEFIKNSKLILKSQQRFRSEKHKVFTEKFNKIALSASDDKIIQLID